MLAYAKVGQYNCATATGARTDSVWYPNYCFSLDSLLITLRSVSFPRQGKRNNLFSIRSPSPWRVIRMNVIGGVTWRWWWWWGGGPAAHRIRWRRPPRRQLYQRLFGLAAVQQDGIQLWGNSSRRESFKSKRLYLSLSQDSTCLSALNRQHTRWLDSCLVRICNQVKHF